MVVRVDWVTCVRVGGSVRDRVHVLSFSVGNVCGGSKSRLEIFGDFRFWRRF